MARRGKEYEYQKDDRTAAIRRRRELVMRMQEMKRNFYPEQVSEEEETWRKKNLQTKLEINDPGDEHEQEADHVAKKVVNGEGVNGVSSAVLGIHKKHDYDSGTLMAKGGDGGLNGTTELQTKLDASKGGGQSLDDKTKSEMESKMSADLSDVKIHTGTNAHEMAEGINAKAFTHGQDIYFKDGNYNTNSSEGKELLAHELAHTQQQKDGLERKLQRQHDKNREHYPGVFRLGGILYSKADEKSKIIFTADEEYNCEVWGKKKINDQIWLYIVVDNKANNYGWVKSPQAAMENPAVQLETVTIRASINTPDIITELQSFNVKFGGEPFEVKIKYEKILTEERESISFNLYYKGTGFADHQPLKINLGSSFPPLSDLLEKHKDDFEKSNPKPQGLTPEIKNVEKWNQANFERIFKNKAAIREGDTGMLNNKQTSYACFSIDYISAGGMYANHLDLQIVIYDDTSTGTYWSPAEKIHSFSFATFSPSDNNDQGVMPKSTTGLIARLNSKNKKSQKEKIESLYNERTGYIYPLIVVPDGAIRKDQEAQLYTSVQKPTAQSGYGFGKKITFDNQTELALALSKLESIENDKALNIKKWKLRKVIAHLKDLYTLNDNESNQAGADYHSLAVDSSLRINEVKNLIWPGKGTNDAGAAVFQKAVDNVVSLYVDALYVSIKDLAAGRTSYKYSERRRISLKDRIAAAIVRGNGETANTYYGARKIFESLDNDKANGDPKWGINSYLSTIWGSASFGLANTRKGLFSKNEPEDLSITDINTKEFGYERAQKLAFDISMFDKLTRVYYAYQMLFRTQKLEQTVWNILQDKSVSKDYLDRKRKELEPKINDIEKILSENIMQPSITAIIPLINDASKIISGDFMLNVQRMYRSLARSYDKQDTIVQIIVLVCSFLLAEFGGAVLGMFVEAESLTFSAVSFLIEIGSFGGMKFWGEKQMGKQDANLFEDLGAAFLMVGFLRATSFGFQRFYKMKYGDVQMPGTTKLASSFVSLQAYAELSHLVTSGKIMGMDERMHNLFVNFISMVTLGIVRKFTVEPLENAMLKLASKQQWYWKNAALRDIETNLKAKTAEVTPLRKKAMANGKADDALVEKMGELHNLEEQYIVELKKTVNNADKLELSPKQRQALLAELQRLHNQSIGAVRDTQLSLALAGIALPIGPAAIIEFYPLQPGEVGFKSSTIDYLKTRFGKNFKEVVPGSGVYVASVEGGEPVTFLSEAAVKKRMLGDDEQATQGYELYKKDKKLEGVFETLNTITDKPFNSLKEFFKEYKISNTKANSLPLIKDIVVKKSLIDYINLTGIKDVAFGVDKKDELQEFSKKVNASNNKMWKDIGLQKEGDDCWGKVFYEAVYQYLAAGGKIKFNLDGLDYEGALANPDYIFWSGRYTAWELQQIVRNPDFYNNTLFYENNEVLTMDKLKEKGIVPMKPVSDNDLREMGVINK